MKLIMNGKYSVSEVYELQENVKFDIAIKDDSKNDLARWVLFKMVNGITEGPPRPKRVALGLKIEVSMAKFGIKFNLPPTTVGDVAKRELSVTVNSDEPTVMELPATATESQQIVFDQNDTVTAVLVDVDNSGNRSLPSAPFVYTVVDDVPPPQPNEVSVKEKVQID